MEHGVVQRNPVRQTKIRDGDCLEIHATIIDLPNFSGGEKATREYKIHDVGVIVALKRWEVYVIQFEGRGNTSQERTEGG